MIEDLVNTFPFDTCARWRFSKNMEWDGFRQSLQLGHVPLPTERLPLLDDDLWFCAERHWTVEFGHR